MVGIVACADRYAGGMAWVATGIVLSESGEGGGEDDEGQRGDGRSEKAKHLSGRSQVGGYRLSRGSGAR